MMDNPSSIVQHHRLVKALAKGLRHRCGVRSGARLLLAVSGGADSVALLCAMAALAPRRQWKLDLHVGHVQHHLRDEAEQDAAFVAQLAERLELPFIRADLDLSGEADNLEAAARRQRYAALQAMAKAAQAPFIVTAHHGDDQLETILLRLLRGASLRGLGGMAWRRRLVRASESNIILLRPMLAADHAMACDYLNAIDQPWREDNTNADVQLRRARLRHEVLPVLRAMAPDASAKAVRMADHLRHAAVLVESAIDRAAEHVIREGDSAELDRVDARLLDPIVLNGLLRRLLAQAGAKPDSLGSRTLGPIVRAVRDRRGGERSFDLAGGVRVVIDRQTVCVES